MAIDGALVVWEQRIHLRMEDINILNQYIEYMFNIIIFISHYRPFAQEICKEIIEKVSCILICYDP